MCRKLFFLMIVSLIGFFSCTEENLIGVALHNGEELSSGDSVPFILQQNYPNPFNPTTIIGFYVVYNMKLKLTVFTSDWVEVEIMFNKTIGPGEFRYTFNAKDFPSGDYFYALEGEGHMQIRKMKIAK